MERSVTQVRQFAFQPVRGLLHVREWNGPETLGKTAFLYPLPLSFSTASFSASAFPRDHLFREFEVCGNGHVTSMDISARIGAIFYVAPISATIPPFPFGQASSLRSLSFL